MNFETTNCLIVTHTFLFLLFISSVRIGISVTGLYL